MYDMVVIGGGVIGLSIARQISGNQSVLLLERGVAGEGTSWAAAGMLTPQSEADDEGAFFQLSMASLRMYRKFVEELKLESGIDPEYDDAGLLVLASSGNEMAVLESRAAWQRAAGMSVDILNSAEVLLLEPLITANVPGGLFMPGDHQVVPRKLAMALVDSCRRRNVEIRSGVSVDAVVHDGNRVAGVFAGGEKIQANHVVVSSGVWSGSIEGLAPPIPVYPRKGQILSLNMPGKAFRHMIRWNHAYFVPRRDGELVVGATNEDVGFDRALTPAGLGGLLAEAQEISSHVGAFAIREMWTGLRPATPDGLPILGRTGIEGLLYAAGHYRNGILLAPVTATVIAALIDGQSSPVPIEAFASARFNV